MRWRHGARWSTPARSTTSRHFGPPDQQPAPHVRSLPTCRTAEPLGRAGATAGSGLRGRVGVVWSGGKQVGVFGGTSAAVALAVEGVAGGGGPGEPVVARRGEGPAA